MESKQNDLQQEDLKQDDLDCLTADISASRWNSHPHSRLSKEELKRLRPIHLRHVSITKLPLHIAKQTLKKHILRNAPHGYLYIQRNDNDSTAYIELQSIQAAQECIDYNNLRSYSSATLEAKHGTAIYCQTYFKNRRCRRKYCPKLHGYTSSNMIQCDICQEYKYPKQFPASLGIGKYCKKCVWTLKNDKNKNNDNDGDSKETDDNDKSWRERYDQVNKQLLMMQEWCSDTHTKYGHFMEKDYKKWTGSVIVNWIVHLDKNKYSKYKQALLVNMKNEEIDESFLDDLTKNDLHRLGIINDGDKQRIWKKIQVLKWIDI